MDVSFLAVGDELLDGRVQDSNLSRLGDLLDDFGATVRSARIAEDRKPAIRRALGEAADEAAIVVVSGGLGPTRDDITRYAAAEWAGAEIELDEAHLARLQALFDEHGYTFTDNNRGQCEFPAGAEILPSNVGTASGFRLPHDGVDAYFFPGVPSEFGWYLEQFLRPRLEATSKFTPREKATLTFLGPGESSLEDRLEDLLAEGEAAGAEARFLAHAPLVTLEISGHDPEVVERIRAAILQRSGDWVIAEDGAAPAERAGRLLEENGARVTVAESCTAGWLAKELTDVPGSSEWFEYGFVTYANRAKRDMLGVREATLETHGAVSRQTVVEMARGARERADADWALSISGIAGPSGGTEAKPVGRVHFALAGPDGIFHKRATFPDRGREFIRRASVLTALGGLIWELEGCLDVHDWEAL